MADFKIHDDSEMEFAIKPEDIKDSLGNVTILGGPITWSTSDPTVATVTPLTEDGTSFKVVTAGPLGTVQVTGTADADPSELVSDISTVFTCEVIPGMAATFTPTPGAETKIR